MKRFLIFICLFPALALLGLFAFISVAIAALPDNPEAIVLVGWAYVVCAVPALICALADLFFARRRILPIAGTALVGYGMALLAALAIFDWGLTGRILAFGLIGAIPAAICSWLSARSMSVRADE